MLMGCLVKKRRCSETLNFYPIHICHSRLQILSFLKVIKILKLFRVFYEAILFNDHEICYFFSSLFTRVASALIKIQKLSLLACRVWRLYHFLAHPVTLNSDLFVEVISSDDLDVILTITL